MTPELRRVQALGVRTRRIPRSTEPSLRNSIPPGFRDRTTHYDAALGGLDRTRAEPAKRDMTTVPDLANSRE